MDNVTQVINRIEGDKARVLKLPYCVIPSSVIDDIQRYSTDTEKNKAYANYFVTVYPEASWICLTEILCLNAKFAAARESKSFMSNGKVCR